MFCPDCGLETTEGNRFCKRCGHRLSHGSNVIQEELINAVSQNNGQAESSVAGVEHRIEQLLHDAMRCQSEGRYQEALMICEAIIEVDKANTSAHSMMAIVYERMGKTALAIEQLRIVVQQNPGSIADQIKLDELQQSVGVHSPHAVAGASRSLPFTVRRPLNPLLLAIISAATVFVLGAVALNYIPSRHAPIKAASSNNTTNNLVPPQTSGISIPQAQPDGTGSPQTPNNQGVIQPYIAGGNTPQVPQQTNPLVQTPPQQPSYQPRPSGNSGSGSGLASIPALPPITGLTTERDTPSPSPSQPANEKQEPKPQNRTAPENNAPTGIYEITVNSGSANRPRPTQSGNNEADTLIRIAAQKSADGDYRGAIESYTAAQSYGANSASISNSIAQAHRRLNNIQDARKAYQDALKKANDAISRGTNVPQATRDKENAEQGLKACGD